MKLLAEVAEAARKAWRFLIGETDVAYEALKRALEDNFDGVVIIAENGRIIAASNVAAALLGQEGVLIGRQAANVVPEAILHAVQRAFANGRRAVPSPITPALVGKPDDADAASQVVQFVVTLSEIGQHSGLPRRVVGLTFWDESDRRRREQELAFIGTHDQLTGAMNRGELIRTINARFESERQRAAGLMVLVVDLTRFKAVNGVLGHAYGDMLLKLVVSRLRAAGVDSVARLDGDTFAMVRVGRPAPDETRDICKALIERLSLPYALDGHRAIIGAAIGVTHTDVSGPDAEQLLTHAELALATARNTPGTQFVAFTAEMDQRLKQQQAMDLALRVAQERGQLSMVYQPQCSLETGELIGVEAMVRWAHPEFGVIPPERFVPAAEENGEIVEIGRWALKTACQEAASWPFHSRLAVNVSRVQFEFCDIVAEVGDALRQSGLPAHRLDLEIDESAFAPDGGHLVDTLRELRRLGVGIALDHFGTGYSSLGYLGRLPVDKIKIDKSFVSGLPADAEAGAIIRAVMTLSETLGKVVIADGIETKDQAWMLRMIGCRIGQGNQFGRPRTGEQMARWQKGGKAGDLLAG